MSHTQEHDKFKFFQAPCASEADLKKLFKKVEKWVASNKVAPKSIGILWSPTGIFSVKSQTAIMSLGFGEKEPYEIILTLAGAGSLIEECLEANVVIDFNNSTATKKSPSRKKGVPIDKVLCHELLLFNDEVYVIFMSKK